MAHTRYIKPDFFKDEDIAELEYWVRLLYIGLWILADKEGRLEYRSKRINVELFPYDKVNIELGLKELMKNKSNSNKPYIYIYEDKGNSYIQIINWHKYQKPHFTEKESIIPAYNNNDSALKDLKTKYNLKIKATGSDLEVKEPLINVDLTVRDTKFDFETVWNSYPNKLGKKAAKGHFNTSVKNATDYNNLIKAINNYKKDIEYKKIEDKYIKHGFTFFNNWQDWVDYENSEISKQRQQEQRCLEKEQKEKKRLEKVEQEYRDKNK